MMETGSDIGKEEDAPESELSLLLATFRDIDDRLGAIGEKVNNRIGDILGHSISAPAAKEDKQEDNSFISHMRTYAARIDTNLSEVEAQIDRL